MSNVRDLLPASFALVMATGIVSIALSLWGQTGVATGMLGLNSAFYLVLLVMLALRVAFFRKQIVEDLDNPKKAPGFLTFVAGTNVLANQWLIVGKEQGTFLCLGLFGVVLWALVTYIFTFRAITSEKKVDGVFPISGVWLLLTVATQSASVVLSNFSNEFPSIHDGAWMGAFLLFLLGAVFYILILGHVVLRIFFSPIASSDMVPPNWIILGAAAISTMAGAALLASFSDSAASFTSPQILKTFTMGLWATATWWGPLLVGLGIWKHWIKKDSLRYEPQLWSLVFPLGMYSAATYKLAVSVELDWMKTISLVVLPLAVSAWLWVFVKASKSWRRSLSL